MNELHTHTNLAIKLIQDNTMKKWLNRFDNYHIQLTCISLITCLFLDLFKAWVDITKGGDVQRKNIVNNVDMSSLRAPYKNKLTENKNQPFRINFFRIFLFIVLQ